MSPLYKDTSELEKVHPDVSVNLITGDDRIPPYFQIDQFVTENNIEEIMHLIIKLTKSHGIEAIEVYCALGLSRSPGLQTALEKYYKITEPEGSLKVTLGGNFLFSLGNNLARIASGRLKPYPKTTIVLCMDLRNGSEKAALKALRRFLTCFEEGTIFIVCPMLEITKRI